MRITILTKLVVTFLAVSLIPLAIVGYVSLQDAKEIGYGAAKDAENLGEEAVSDTTEAITELVGDAFLKLAKRIVENIRNVLSEREKDAVALADIVSKSEAEPSVVGGLLQAFAQSKTAEYRFNTGTDLKPIEGREQLPIYSEVAWIDAGGMELVKVVDGKIASQLTDVSKPENTTFKSETYFEKVKALKVGEVYVSRVNTWYTSEAEARKGVTGDPKAWNIVPKRDVMKKGNIRFGSPIFRDGVFDGMILLSMDYRHLQGLTKHIDPAEDAPVLSTTYEGNYILMFDDLGDTIVHPKPNNIRGYLPDGTLEHRNTIATPGGIFNLEKFDSSTTYKEIFETTVGKGDDLVKSATDVKGRNKMTISVPIPYDRGEYRGRGRFGGIMLSVNTERFYDTARKTEQKISDKITATNARIKQSTEGVQTENTILAVTLVTILVVVILGIGAANSISKPIRDLTKVANVISDGNVDVEIPVIKTRDEIYDLGESMKAVLAAVDFFRETLGMNEEE